MCSKIYTTDAAMRVRGKVEMGGGEEGEIGIGRSISACVNKTVSYFRAENTIRVRSKYILILNPCVFNNDNIPVRLDELAGKRTGSDAREKHTWQRIVKTTSHSEDRWNFVEGMIRRFLNI